MGEEREFSSSLQALSSTERQRHQELSKKVREARAKTQDLPDGYEFRLQSEMISLAELAEWISATRRCCPFLKFDVDFPRGSGAIYWGLRLKGTEGVKPVIRSLFSTYTK
jgi:hypothetical protein